MFERLLKFTRFDPDSYSFLNEQYRMHPGISSIVSALTYEGKLIDSEDLESSDESTVSELFPNPKKPIHMVDTLGLELKTNRSFTNGNQAAEVLKILNIFRLANIDFGRIGVICMY